VQEQPEGPRRETPRRVQRGWRLTPGQVLWIVILVLVLVFALVNFQEAKIDLVFGQLTMPLFFAIAVPALVGFVAGALFQRHRTRRRRDTS
jgi:uncharacterized integral membrane protein